MPALDPLAGSSKGPSGGFDSAPSNPLTFASTLQTLDPNRPLGAISGSITGKPSTVYSIGHGPAPSTKRLYNNPLPDEFPAPIWSRHERSSSVSSEAIRVGSDEWMDAQLQLCIDKAEPTLHLSKKGLTTLSTKIADLQHLVTFPSSRSGLSSSTSSRFVSSPSPRASPAPAISPLPPHPTQSPGRDPFSSDARPFARTASAPASAAPFVRSNAFKPTASVSASSSNGFLAPRTAFARVPSTLRGLSLLDSPAISETSEDAGQVGYEAVREVSDASTDSRAEGASSLRQLGTKRQFGRNHTRMVLPTPSSPVLGSSKGPVIWLQHNELTILPSALFEISNLTALSLSHNKLTELPAAIGSLHALTELNIGGNQLKYLPYTILSLKFDTLSVHPNPFLWPPPDERITSVDGGVLGPLTRHTSSNIPSLSSIASNMLISPHAPSGLPPLLEYESYETESDKQHPLLDPTIMRKKYLKSVGEAAIPRVLRAMRSICTDLEAKARAGNNRLSASTSSHPRPDLFPNLNRPSKPDDAALNPYYSPCPGPRHRIHDTYAPYDHVTRQLYLHPAEERIEWRTLHTWPSIPIKWTGCSPGCLRFLEHDDDAEWELSDEDEL